MKTLKLLVVILFICFGLRVVAQKNELIPNLSEVKDTSIWSVFDRNVTYNNSVYLNVSDGDGLLWLKQFVFSNSKIELDIKGRNEAGRSFVGFAFHGLNDTTYDAVYFRPFNFKNPDRSNHSVQYVSYPKYTWYKLREENPGKYENTINPIPNPDDWFHATIIIEFPIVKVFVNNSESPSLIVNQLNSRKEGWIGFWVGNSSEGYFKNLKITSY